LGGDYGKSTKVLTPERTSNEHTDKQRANNPPVGVVTSISWLAPSLTQEILDGAAFGIPV